MSAEFDLAVIGAGPGGYEAAIRASRLGLKVVLVEEKDLGGTCLNWGCIPTKSLLQSAEVFHEAQRAAIFGISTGPVGFDYAKIAARKDDVVRKLRTGIERLVAGSGCTVVRGRASFVDRHTLAVEGLQGQTIQAERVLIATGSRPSRPPIPGIDGDKVIDSDGVLAMTACPERLIILGGGVIGVEFATVFHRLGREVVILEMLDAIVPGVDAEIGKLLRRSLEKKGVAIHTGARVTSIRSEETAATCTFQTSDGEKQVSGDVVIVAAGRRPNTESLGLEAVGVVLERGFIRVDDRMETSVPGIYAIGDVVGGPQLAHVASAQGLVAAANAAGAHERFRSDVVPACIYTTPEIAGVGMTEAEAEKLGRPLRIGRFAVSGNGRSLLMDESEGLVKIISDEKTGEILGAHIMVPRATELIGELCVAMKLEATVEELRATIHPHPTVSEMILEAAHDVEGMSVHKPAKNRP